MLNVKRLHLISNKNIQGECYVSRSIVWRWKGESTPKKINVACPRVWCTKYSLVLWIVLLLWCCEVLSESPPAWRKSEGWLVPKAAVYTRLLTTITTRGEESPGLSTVKSRHCCCLDFDRTQTNSVWRGGIGWHQDGNQYPESTPLHCIVHWGQRQHNLTPNTSIDKKWLPKDGRQHSAWGLHWVQRQGYPCPPTRGRWQSGRTPTTCRTATATTRT